MFIGRYYHTIEAKGRLIIPKEYRNQLKSGGVLTRGLDGCLFVFPKSYWTALSEKLASIPMTNSTGRQFVRFLVQSSVDLDLDAQGRLLVPDYLRLSAKLQKQVVVAGALTRIEIWDRESYHQHLDLLEKSLSVEDLDSLSALGI
jgi:MraZ protein